MSLATNQGVAKAPAPRLLQVIAGELGELPGEKPWRDEVLRRAWRLQAALRQRDRPAVFEAAAALVGLGEGSTPAGDDYLVGVLHALRCSTDDALRARGPDHDDSLVVALGAFGHGRTTKASAAWLEAAARGDASPVWRELLSALAAADGERVARAAGAVRATGHTSGAYSLRGFVDTLAG